ncbi:MAG: hypothetical protein GX802_00120 [Clostridiales bacterium]|jgi:hypothetical protein|nr:hypothetical protein [Clostridiales bacterium]
MCCFAAPLVEAVVVTVVKKAVEKKENKAEVNCKTPKKSMWVKKLSWLNNMLWGGVLLLLIEHVWHGEIVPWPPFLTAMKTPESTAEMLREIAIYGTSMSVLITAVWAVMVLIAIRVDKKQAIKVVEGV